MSEKLNNNINNNNSSENHMEHIEAEVQDVKSDTNTETINEDAPIITFVADAPKTSIFLSETTGGKETSLTFKDSHNKLIEKERENLYRWNYIDDENNSKSNLKEKQKNKKKNKNLRLKIFAAAMSVMFVISCISTVSMLGRMNNADEPSETPVISNTKAAETDVNSLLENLDIAIGGDKNAKVLTVPQIIEKVKPSVVGIEVITEVSSSFFGRGTSYEQQSVGTGFILTEDGYIATNYHVIEGAKEVKVTLNSGETYMAELIGGDEAADIAVIKIEAKNLPVAELGDSDVLIQGDDVVAIGTPAGIEFAGTATKGIVSAINRDIDVPVGSGFSSRVKNMTVIQTDASINPGNSGGPLVNDKGQVIGINTMKLSSDYFEGMGFAIPINIVIPVINDIIANPGIKLDAGENTAVGYGAEDTSTVSFGLSGATVTEEESEFSGIPQGWKIGAISEDGPCYNTGIQLSDIIIALDGNSVESYEDLVELKYNYKPGDKATITVYRNGDTYNFEITFAARK